MEPAQLEFLLRTAVLEPMCAPLCDAVLERDDSAQLLEQLERQNLFVVALDHQRRWFRYHHLFREMLQAELERREPELPATLNRRAAAWCTANGQPEAAIEYSVAAGDTDEVATLVGALAGTYYRSGRVTTVERWLAHFDDTDLLERYPAIAVSGAWIHALRGRAEAAERWALAVETARVRGPDAGRKPARGLGGHGPRVALQRRRRADAGRRRARVVSPARAEPVAPRLRAHARDGDAVLGGGRPGGGRSWARLRRRPSPEERPGPAWSRAPSGRSWRWSGAIWPQQRRSSPWPTPSSRTCRRRTMS